MIKQAKKLILVSALLVTYVANAQWTKIPGFSEHTSRLLFSHGKLVVTDEQSSSAYQMLLSTGKWEKIKDKSGSSFSYDIAWVHFFDYNVSANDIYRDSMTNWIFTY